jgi:cysteinyl-tRNA synthetase
LRALGEPPADGPWAGPPVLRAGVAPDRPIGTRDGVTGHGGGDDIALTDRAHAPAAPLSPAGRALHDRFVAALDDDLDLANALAVVREAVRAPIRDDERRWLALDADFVLGLDLDRVWETDEEAADSPVPADIKAIVDERAAARAARDFSRADELRDRLAASGWEVVDGPAGSEVRPAR